MSKYRSIAIENPELAEEWHPTRNGSLTPLEVTLGSSKPVWWICPKCNSIYEKSPYKRLVGENCPYCSGKKVKVGYNDLETWCKNNNRYDLIQEFDEKKNGFKMTEITTGNGKKVWWICPKGHSYQATLHHRIKMGTGCGVCSHKVFRQGENDLLTTNPEIAKEWDYEKNSVNPNEVMVGSNKTKYWFICPKGHSYNATLLNRKNGTNCPICSMEKHTSFPEKAIFYYIKKHFVEAEENFKNTISGRMEIDIYLPKQKIGIEYDGAAWHKDYTRDIKKDNMCKTHSITLIRIREKGCVEYSSDCIKKYIQPYNMQDLNEAIRFIFEFINREYQLDIRVDIDVNRDRLNILEKINMSEKEKSIASYCPEIKKYWDYDKNGKITPEMISYGSGKTVYLKCDSGHTWTTVAREFSKRSWCPYCEGHKLLLGKNDLFTTNPELIPLWSPNNTIDPKAIKSGCNTKALWRCPNCGGEYEMIVHDKVIGRGCPYCSGHRVLKGFNDLATLVPELIEEWNYEKNAPLEPDAVTKGSNKKVWWLCKKGHTWQATIAKRTSGQECPICSGRIVLSGYNDLASKYPNISAQWHPTKNGELTPQTVSPFSHKKVWWICSMGHEWQASIKNRVNGTGCPFCNKTKGER